MLSIGIGGWVVVAATSPSSISGAATVGALAQRLTPPAGAVGNIGGCNVFPADNPWNMRVDNLALRAGSAQTIARLQGKLHPDFGANFGIPFAVVPANQPVVPVTFDQADESDAGPYPIPPTAPIEAGSDAHVLVLQQSSCRLFEMDAAARQGNGWTAYSGAVFDLNSNALRPYGFTSADAAGLAILPGLVRYDEVAAGVIKHPIRVTFSQTQNTFIFPANHQASSHPDADLPPMGLRLRMRADYDISGLRGQALIVATAMKQYGFIVADNGSNWFFQGAPDPRWSDDDLSQLKNIPGTAFEVVDTGPTHSS